MAAASQWREREKERAKAARVLNPIDNPPAQSLEWAALLHDGAGFCDLRCEIRAGMRACSCLCVRCVCDREEEHNVKIIDFHLREYVCMTCVIIRGWLKLQNI